MRFPANNQNGIQNPVNFQVDFVDLPNYSIIPELWIATRPDFGDAVARQFGVNAHTGAVALSDNTVYYWKYRIHSGYTDPVTHHVFDQGWSAFSEVWIFRSATNSGQLPPAPVTTPPANLPPTNVPPSPTVTNPNNASQAGFLSEVTSGFAGGVGWVIAAAIVGAIFVAFKSKK